jgi:hypothetical protein
LGIDTLYYLTLDGTRVYIYQLSITFHLELPVPHSQLEQSSEVRNRVIDILRQS